MWGLGLVSGGSRVWATTDSRRGRGVFIRLAAAGLLAAAALGAANGYAQLAVPAAKPAAEKASAPTDPYTRGSPRALATGLVAAFAASDYERAAHYLEGEESRPKTLLARQLHQLLDSRGSLAPFATLSSEIAGLLGDGLPADQERIGTIKAPAGELPIVAHNVAAGDDPPRWVISAQTLAMVARQTPQPAAPVLADKLPEALSEKHVGGASIADWLIVIGLAVAAFGLIRLLFALVLRGLRALIEEPRKNRAYQFLHVASPPLSLYLSVIAFFIVTQSVQVAIVARQTLLRYAGIVGWIALAWFLWRLIDLGAAMWSQRMARSDRRRALSALVFGRRTAKTLLVLVALGAVLDTLGVDVTTGIAALGIGGLALALGAQKTIENLVGSVTVIADQPVRVGDFCKVGDVLGTVEDIGMRSTRIRTNERTVVTIPNGVFSSQQIENYSRRDRYLFAPTIGLTYDTDAALMRRVLDGIRQVLEEDDNVADEPRVRFVNLQRALARHRNLCLHQHVRLRLVARHARAGAAEDHGQDRRTRCEHRVPDADGAGQVGLSAAPAKTPQRFLAPSPVMTVESAMIDASGSQRGRSGASALLAAVAIGIGLLAGCAELPSQGGRTVSAALQDTAGTALGQAIQPRVQRHPGLSGIHLLDDSNDAFAARMLLAHRAERSLDVQCYIWRNDLTGTLLFEALHRAAGRGVRVRLLLDDNNTSGLDGTLAALDSHPNIEVRLFNPFAVRNPRAIGYLTDFSRLNRRMHNKSFTADNQATLVGGRNIGDEYFGAGTGTWFADLDVLAIGPVVQAVSSDFDRYWASGSAYPADRLLPAAEAGALDELTQRAAQVEADARAAAYVEAVRTSSFVERLVNHELELLWAPTRMLSDDPAKGLGQAPPQELLVASLKPALGPIEQELQIVSPYFVPAEKGTGNLLRLASQGVRVSVLTNSLEATDVAAVHAGYAKRRRALLEGGVTLFELQRAALGPAARTRRLGLASGSGGSAKVSGSSAASLHAKTFSADRQRVFIGSFNFDPRSARLNTEMGFAIQSADIAHQIAEAFEGGLLASAYRVRLADDGALEWVEQRGDETIVHRTEPGTSVWQRLLVRLLSVLPIDWLL